MRLFPFKNVKLIYLLSLWVAVACDGRKPPSDKIYQGDIHVVEGIDGIYSEVGHKKVKVKSPYQATLQNNDRKYPRGLYLEFYEEGEVLATTLKSDSAYYKKVEDKWFIEENVVVKNIKTQEILNTDEMIWDRVTRKIIIDTSKTVIIKTPDKIVKGRGLVADENFTDWEMHNVTGIFYTEDETD